MRLCALSGVDQKHARIVPFQIAWVPLLQRFTRRSECREKRVRERYRAVFAALAVMHGEDPRSHMKTLPAELHTCRNPQPYHRFTTSASGGGTCRRIVALS